MKKALFIDRDGTILVEPEDEQVDSWQKMRFVPGAITALRRIATELDYELVMVTNQDGLGTDSFPEETFWPVHNAMLQILEDEMVVFADILIDRTFPATNAPTRKPGTAMLTRYMAGGYDLSQSFVIGDRISDVQLAKNLGSGAIAITSEIIADATLCTKSWDEIESYLRKLPRQAQSIRTTSETGIKAVLSLDGSGRAAINTGLGFLDHMLEQVVRHAQWDLELRADGDLYVDEHHTIEDTAIVLGNALRQALGNKRGIQRYAFVLPMDESLTQMAIDLSGRAHLEWDVPITRERIGDLPTEMIPHFFRTLANAAGLTLHVKTTGENNHHMVESVFKSLGRCLGQATQRTGTSVPSTKGSL